jgi:3-oxoadipate enol-lactonase
MPELEGPAGALHYVVTGVGDPSTVFVPGMAQSIADTRPFGSAVIGSRVFVDLRGHGGSAAPPDDDGWTYSGLANDVRAVADHVCATRAVGVSLGAAAIVRLLVYDPVRFERIVLALPPRLDGPRAEPELEVTDDLAKAIVDGPMGDPAAVASALVGLQPAAVRRRPDVKTWARRHAAELGGNHGTAAACRAMPRQTVLPSLDGLTQVAAEVLVLAQHDDDVHPLGAAQMLVEAIPDAQLVVSDVPWVWGGRAQLRAEVSTFLNR